MAIAYTLTPTSLSLIINWTPTVIPNTHPNYAEIVALVSKPGTAERDITPLLNIQAAVETFSGGNVAVTNGKLFFKGFEIKSKLASLILQYVKTGETDKAKPLEMFLEKAYANPDPRAVEGLFDWVVAAKLPITPTGDILAWKAVQADYMSIRSGTRGKLRHQIGDVVSEPRQETDSDPNRTCSRGIHFCSLEYLQTGGYAGSGSRIMAVAISPTNVVAFPKDYNLSKGRCCELTVVGEVPLDKVPTYYPNGSLVYTGWSAGSTPVPVTPTARFPVQVGDVWRTADGETITITDVGTEKGQYGPTAGAVGHSRRRRWFANGLDNGNGGRGMEMVELIREASAVPKSKGGNIVVKVGDRVRLYDGRICRIDATTSSGIVALQDETSGNHVTHVFTKSGSGWDDNNGLPTDVAEVLKPTTKRNIAGFAVGQVWKRRNGTDVTITSISSGGSYPVRTLGAVYTKEGRFNSSSSVSQFDLVRLIKDVA